MERISGGKQKRENKGCGGLGRESVWGSQGRGGRCACTSLEGGLSFFLSLCTARSSIIDRFTLYTPGCRMLAYK